jgi:hypothetical protein
MGMFLFINTLIMHLSDSAVKKYKELHEKECGEKITDTQAREYAERVMSLMEYLFFKKQITQRLICGSAALHPNSAPLHSAKLRI